MVCGREELVKLGRCQAQGTAELYQRLPIAGAHNTAAQPVDDAGLGQPRQPRRLAGAVAALGE